MSNCPYDSRLRQNSRDSFVPAIPDPVPSSFVQTCPGKCAELQPCVQCQQFQSGVLCEGHDECGIDEPGINLCDHEKCGFTVIEVSWY